jgi:hypothetical protein
MTVLDRLAEVCTASGLANATHQALCREPASLAIAAHTADLLALAAMSCASPPFEIEVRDSDEDGDLCVIVNEAGLDVWGTYTSRPDAEQLLAALNAFTAEVDHAD